MDDIFNESNQVKNNWVKFSVIGDHVAGTLISVRQMRSTLPGKEKEMVNVYEIKTDSGEFHDIDKNKQVIQPAIVINAGEFWNVGGGFGLDAAMRNVRLGQKLGIKFTGEKPNPKKGFNATKIKQVFTKKDAKGNPVMDEAWLEEQRTKNLDDVQQSTIE